MTVRRLIVVVIVKRTYILIAGRSGLGAGAPPGASPDVGFLGVGVPPGASPNADLVGEGVAAGASQNANLKI